MLTPFLRSILKTCTNYSQISGAAEGLGTESSPGEGTWSEVRGVSSWVSKSPPKRMNTLPFGRGLCRCTHRSGREGRPVRMMTTEDGEVTQQVCVALVTVWGGHEETRLRLGSTSTRRRPTVGCVTFSLPADHTIWKLTRGSLVKSLKLIKNHPLRQRTVLRNIIFCIYTKPPINTWPPILPPSQDFSGVKVKTSVHQQHPLMVP